MAEQSVHCTTPGALFAERVTRTDPGFMLAVARI